MFNTYLNDFYSNITQVFSPGTTYLYNTWTRPYSNFLASWVDIFCVPFAKLSSSWLVELRLALSLIITTHQPTPTHPQESRDAAWN